MIDEERTELQVWRNTFTLYAFNDVTGTIQRKVRFTKEMAMCPYCGNTFARLARHLELCNRLDSNRDNTREDMK